MHACMYVCMYTIRRAIRRADRYSVPLIGVLLGDSVLFGDE